MINKTQEQSLKVTGVDLKNDYFSLCQLYAAYASCSRVDSSDGQAILLSERTTKNILQLEFETTNAECIESTPSTGCGHRNG
ncbi:ATP-dependent DNA helicase PIF6-like, partial [Aphis craccivora]